MVPSATGTGGPMQCPKMRAYRALHAAEQMFSDEQRDNPYLVDCSILSRLRRAPQLVKEMPINNRRSRAIS